MGDFTAKLVLPKFIPKEQILGKCVFDSELVYMGVVKEWTYTPDGMIKMVATRNDGTDNPLTVLIPFS